MTGLFDKIRSRVEMPEVASFYGYAPNRSGFICCPFHKDKTPSCKLYVDRFKCFGCGAHGDAVDFVAQLFGLAPLEAVKRIDHDFHLGLEFDGQPDPEELRQLQQIRNARRLFEQWKEEMLNRIDACLRKANRICFENLSAEEAAAVRYREALDYWAGILLHGKHDEQMEVFRDRKGVEMICKTILRNTRKKSPAA